MDSSQKLGILVAILGGLSLMFLGVLYNIGVSGLIMGIFTITMFIVLSTLVSKMIVQLKEKKITREEKF
ncbi:hypothetical protein MKY27_13885 [Solibacillus sp. FSL R5-0449]|uniref:hypothetical protein n=1 Tax=Solibacillus sp. FSL R5-0449 TaxID=2921639 RepID=UPI0030D3CFE2